MFLPYRIESDEMEFDAAGKPIATYALIGINAAFFCVCQFLPAKDLLLLFHGLGFVPEEQSILTIFTYMFMHANWLHIVGNMYFLWLFGRALEQSLGSIKFLVFYLVAGVIAVFVHSAFVPPELADIPCIGASGAISGILGGFVAMFPGIHVECVLMLGLRPILMKPRALIVLGVWFVLQMFDQWIAQSQHSSQVAYGAHIGGFMFGWAMMGIVRTVRKATAEWHELVRDADLQGTAAQINAGKMPAETALANPDVQKMLFLRNGSIPQDPEALSGWVAQLRPDEDAGTSASVVFRSHAEGHAQALDAASTAKGADAMARLGYVSVALGCLFDSLESAADESAQYLLCGISTILWKDLGELEKATRCLENAIAIRPESEAAGRAGRILEHMSSQRV